LEGLTEKKGYIRVKGGRGEKRKEKWKNRGSSALYSSFACFSLSKL